MQSITVSTVPCGSDALVELCHQISSEGSGSIQTAPREHEGSLSFEASDFTIETALDSLTVDEEMVEHTIMKTPERPTEDELGPNEFVVPATAGYLVKKRVLESTGIEAEFFGLPVVEKGVEMAEGRLEITIDGRTITYDNALAISHHMEIPTDEEIHHTVEFMCLGEAR